MGGALRFLQELDGYVARRPAGKRAIGRGRRVSGVWLAERELRAGRCEHTVALNNVGFAWSGAYKTVLLRNALHFLSEDELMSVAGAQAVKAQTAIVHGMLRYADRIVVPTSSMAARVATVKPRIVDRIRVMHHPVSLPSPCPVRSNVILCPVLDAPYKMLAQRLIDLVLAIGNVRKSGAHADTSLLLTLTLDEAVAFHLDLPDWVHLLGRLTPDALHEVQQSARAIVYPTTLESFGYPLAEARLARQPVIAPLTEHAREVAGDALVAYDTDDHQSLETAICTAFALQLDPLVDNPFDPDSYFGELFSLG